MEILTWDKEDYLVNYIIDEGCTVILSSGKSSDKKVLLEKAKEELNAYLIREGGE